MGAAATDQSELFDRGGWWDPDCREFASLRRVSDFRSALLSRWLEDVCGKTIVDLGCGGGLLGVPLAAAGAHVVGIDIATAALRAGRIQSHRIRDEAEQTIGSYWPAAASMQEVPLRSGCADVVLLADVLEHVAEPARAVAEGARLLRPGGQLFVNTIDRTLRSRVLAIWLAEGLGLVPRKTHEWRKFIRPAELDKMADAAGLRLVRRTGEAPRLAATVRRWSIELRESRSTAVGYGALFEKQNGANPAASAS
ncbi:MAG: bifunctional 2-polyprenyl-6-hydroxyphenol methylase/3-demethylubiquinol 3-O-methyltransferase UbiG [Planctomycetota bacterium]